MRATWQKQYIIKPKGMEISIVATLPPVRTSSEPHGQYKNNA
jgi:hypothetical protein